MDDHFLPAIGRKQRFVYIGPTQCGKSTLARAQLAAQDDFIILAPKRSWRWVDVNGRPLPGRRFTRFATSFEELVHVRLDVEREGSGAAIVYQPPPDHWQQKNIWKIDRVYELAFKSGGLGVYCDDQYFLTPYTSSERATNVLPWWFNCYTAGAELEVPIGCALQRPVGVPLITINQTDVRYAFFQRQPDDQKSVEALCGPVDWATLAAEDHSFVWATDKFTSAPMRLVNAPPEMPAIA